VTWKGNCKNGSETEQGKKEKAIQTQGGRISDGSHTIEWSREKNLHFSMRKEDRVGASKRVVSSSLLLRDPYTLAMETMERFP